MEHQGKGYYERKSLRRALKLFFLGKGVSCFVGIAWLLLLVKCLSAKEYGFYVGMIAFLEVFNQCSSFGLTPIADRYIAEFRAQRTEPALRLLIKKIVALRSLGILFLATLSAVVLPWHANWLGLTSVDSAFLIFHITLAVESLLRFIETIFDSLLMQGRSQTSLISRTAIRLLFVFAASWAYERLSLYQLVWIEALSFTAGMFITLMLLRRTLNELAQGPSVQVNLRPMLSFALPIYASSIVGSFTSLDTIKLLVLRSTDPITSASFGFCASLVSMLQRYLPSFLLVGILRPLIITTAHDVGRLRLVTSVFIKANGIILGGMFALSVTVATPVVTLLSHGKFPDAGSLLPFFIVFSFTQTLRNVYAHVALAHGQGRSMLLGQIISLLALGCIGVSAPHMELYAYCLGAIIIDTLWLTTVVKTWKAALAPPILPAQGMARVTVAALLATAIGLSKIHLGPSNGHTLSPNHWVETAFIVGLTYIMACCCAPPLSRSETDLIYSFLPKGPKIFTAARFRLHQRPKSLALFFFKKIFFKFLSLICLVRLRKLSRRPSQNSSGRPQHLVILPPHPGNHFGSRGDQAMIMAAISEFLSIHPGGRVSIITTPKISDSSIRELNVGLIPIWGKYTWAPRWNDYLADASIFACVGADVMDGHYWPLSVLRSIELCEVARLNGAKVGIIGFSFNSHPDRDCVRALRDMHKDIRTLLRDPISAERFRRLVRQPTSLVSDAAFCLTPHSSNITRDAAQWVTHQEALGRPIVGFNFHSLLLSTIDGFSESTVIQNLAIALTRLIHQERASLLFIPHDFRDQRNDATILADILDHIDRDLHPYAMLLCAEPTAQELKTVTAYCDLVITGRMHLAIAALGMGTPVSVISYQEKFEGLLQQFGLPSVCAMSTQRLGDADAIWAWIKQGFDQYRLWADVVNTRLPTVKELSKENFAWMATRQEAAEVA